MQNANMPTKSVGMAPKKMRCFPADGTRKVPATLIRTEPERFRGYFAGQRIFEEFAAAVGAEVKPQLLIDVVADAIVVGVFHALENVLNFLQMIVIFVIRAGVGIVSGKNFYLDDVTQIVIGVEIALAEVA
jgi:hypothetical protein